MARRLLGGLRRHRPTGSEDARRAAELRSPGDRLPDFLIAGAQKSGTGSLYRFLGRHPDVLPAKWKETHYFDLKYGRGLDWYRRCFPEPAAATATDRTYVTGEASPYYLFHPLAPERARAALPDVRVIVMLRNPVERALSQYNHSVVKGYEELPLREALHAEPERLEGEAERMRAAGDYHSFSHQHHSYVARGLYLEQLEAWWRLFNDDQVLVIDSNRLFAEPEATLFRVLDFLSLARQDLGFEAHSARRYDAPPPDVEEMLYERFAEPNARLYERMGEDYGWEAGRGGGA